MKTAQDSTLKGKKKIFYETLKGQLGSVTSTAKQTGIGRRTHYEWMKKDKDYKEAIDGVQDFIFEFVENALFKSIKSGSVPAQIFYLKTKGKDKGYVERQEIANTNFNMDFDMEQIRQSIKAGSGLSADYFKQDPETGEWINTLEVEKEKVKEIEIKEEDEVFL